MIAIWPTSLPRPERNSWQSAPQEARLKRQSETGPPGFRRRFSSAATTVNLSLVLTRQQKAVFDHFFDTETAYGSLLFRMPDPTTDGWAAQTDDGGTLLTASGSPILLAASWLCLFGDMLPTETIQATEFRKTFSVVVMP
ncbi:hypothetical protein [Oceaniglobus trochenteri]|uniref:hypothetical protein n=1 Tax=Oceaniglobus trochenteri TaxID=2763260 RepID=UPI001CFFB95D|nr:hypothetical protein [Oceaniglobus trochenteri]